MDGISSIQDYEVSCPSELTAIVAPSLEINRLRQTFREVATNIPGAQSSTDYVLVITTRATEYFLLTVSRATF